MSVELAFVDFDDTIVNTAPRFEGARRDLFALLGSSGFDAEVAARLHHDEIDPAMREQFGFGPHRLEHSFRRTYERLRELAQHDVDDVLAERCAALGRAVAGVPPAFEGAVEALRRLASAFPTVLYTQAGDHSYQMECIRATGILDVLPHSHVRIAVSKGVDDFRAALLAYDVRNVADVWMIGNSMRSDVNPALQCGARAILVEVADPWHYDMVEPYSPDYLVASSFAVAVDMLMGLS